MRTIYPAHYITPYLVSLNVFGEKNKFDTLRCVIPIVLLIQESCVLCCTDRQTQLVYSVWVLLQNSIYFFQQIIKEPTTCFGLYRKAIIRLYIIVDLSALGVEGTRFRLTNYVWGLG
jgi:hypothetical protein